MDSTGHLSSFFSYLDLIELVVFRLIVFGFSVYGACHLALKLYTSEKPHPPQDVPQIRPIHASTARSHALPEQPGSNETLVQEEAAVDAEVRLASDRLVCNRAITMSEAPVEKLENKHGGRREGSGRKPLLDKAEIARVKELIAQHGLQVDESDLKRRTRILRLLDVLYEKGVTKDDVRAIREYLDRMLGKSKEQIEHSGNLPFNLTIVQKHGGKTD